ncbi:MAG TPA: hypothetical protein VKO18_10955 [Terriglobia bacterium]|nr:hypothetical protein [Terriglobia bacterium]
MDELAGDWLPMSSLGSYPALSNFLGSLQATDDMVGVKHLTFPPFSQAQDSGILRVNGRPLRATDSRWYAYQVLRRNRSAEMDVESSVRLVHENRGVLFRLMLENTQRTAQDLEITAELAGRVGEYESGWDWTLPVPKDGNEFTADRAGGGSVLLVRHTRSSACVAFAFVQTPDRLELEGNRGRVTWKVPVNPRQTRIIEFVMAVADSDDKATHLAIKWAGGFEKAFDSAKTLWEKRFADAFVPGNGYFSGNLPVLTTPDGALRRIYYMSILSSELLMLRTNFTSQPRIYITAAPQYAVTLTYFWDSAIVSVLTALLDPVMMREQLKRWLTMNVHRCYAQDSFSGQARGPWYSANDISLFEMLRAYLQVTGDRAFLNETAGEKTVTEHMRNLATHWRQLVRSDSSLADYGAADNLLECVPTYIHAVASLNAANVGMMRAFADLTESRGEGGEAAQLRKEAKHLAAAVLRLYVPGQGVWDCLQPDGKRQRVRHVYDFIMTGNWMSEDLSSSMRSEMVRFVEQELMAKYWLRALSLKDSAAPQSDRPDHGPMGAYDAWPPLALATMNRLGYQKEALDALHRFESVTHEGPFSQSHELRGREYDAPVRVTEREDQTTNELCGGAFADVIISSFFGFQPDWAGKLAIVNPELPRGFEGRLTGLRWQGKLYTLTSSTHGVSMRMQ